VVDFIGQKPQKAKNKRNKAHIFACVSFLFSTPRAYVGELVNESQLPVFPSLPLRILSTCVLWLFG
jgi:hypothetical protein